MRRLGWLVSGLIATFLVAGLLPASAAPASTTSLTGLAISPAIQQIVLSPSQTTDTFSVQLYNHTAEPINLELSTADFTALNQTGGVAFLGGEVNAENDPHGLGSYLTFASKTVTLAANATAIVPVTITHANALATGGHYAAILARIAGSSSASQGNRVTLNQEVSSLVFVETGGVGTKTIKLLKPDIDKISFSLPSSLDLVFAATGNTQTVPRGTVAVGKQSRQPLLNGIINTNSSLILPGSTRLLPTELTGKTHPWWPGVYNLTLRYRYDGSLGFTTYQTTFFYINVTALLITAAIAILALYLLSRLRRYWLSAPRFVARHVKRIKRLSQSGVTEITRTEIKTTDLVESVPEPESIVDTSLIPEAVEPETPVAPTEAATEVHVRKIMIADPVEETPINEESLAEKPVVKPKQKSPKTTAKKPAKKQPRKRPTKN